TESLVLALVAGSFGLTFAIWGTELLKALAPADVPRLAETKIDVWVLAFTFAVTIAASLIFGLVPALETSRVDLNDALKQGAARDSTKLCWPKLRCFRALLPPVPRGHHPVMSLRTAAIGSITCPRRKV